MVKFNYAFWWFTLLLSCIFKWCVILIELVIKIAILLVSSHSTNVNRQNDDIKNEFKT